MITTLKKMLDLGISQTTMANGIGVSKSTVTSWIQGLKEPSKENELKIKHWVVAWFDEVEKLRP